MTWKVAFLLLGTLALSFADNTTDALAAAYKALFLIPGADFVGFGYDSRFTDPIQAVRIPVMEWGYQETKSYKYPIYKDYVYKVPDELFVRTVARTDMSNFVFQSSEELSEKIAVGAGINYTRSTSGPVTDQADDDEKKALFGGLAKNATTGSNQTITPEQAGYGNQPFIPSTQQTTGTSLFSIGAEFSFLRTQTSDKSKWIVQNEQINQFYQLFLDKRKLRASFQADALNLAGRTWFSNDRKLFINFFEKYGTHIVVSAMMGGAISMTSVVQSSASVTKNTVNLNINVNSNVSTVVSNNATVAEDWIPNHPVCVGRGAAWRKYLYHTFSGLCVLPANVNCTSQMDSFQDPLDSLDNITTASWRWYDGPAKLDKRSSQTKCASYKYCPWNDNAKVTIEGGDNADPKGPYKAKYPLTSSYTIGLELNKVDTQFYRGWETSVTNKDGSKTKKVASYDVGRASYCSSWCQDMNYWWYLLDVAPGFLGKCIYGDTCAEYNIQFYRPPNITAVASPTITGSAGALSIDSRTQDIRGIRRGRYARLQASTPNIFSFWVRSATIPRVPFTTANNRPPIHNVVEGLDGGAQYEDSDDRFAFRFAMANFGGKNVDTGLITANIMGMVDPTSGLVVGAPFQKDQWYKIVLAINWTATPEPTIEMWVDYTLVASVAAPKMRFVGAYKFQDKTTSTLSQINIYHYDVALGYFDAMSFCNPSDRPATVPVSKSYAVATTTAKFRQTVNGQVDFTFENQFGSYTFEQSSNYRLKGGDSSKVDLLDLRKAYNTFEIWKGTIMNNPAPVSFVLKKISHVLPDEVVSGVNRREEMARAIDEYLKIQETDSIIVDRSPDVAITN